MRRFVQKQALELISTLGEGISYAISPGTAQASALTVLDDCHMAVHAISESLQSGLSEERYSYYKQVLDSALKMLGNLMQAMANGQSYSAVLDQLDDRLNFIYNEIVHEPEVKLEVVFLPYKSSMWDSLESIWRAANDDPRCECFVVPIPYFDRNPDTSASEMHYEGEDYPADVPIVNYQIYNISEHRPDVVYIHNPFDGFNIVTSVHPNYYSSALKPYTDKLVYVPYYVLGGGVSETQKHMLAVYGNMDLMVVQSRKYKEFYEGILPADKLLALGSPKIDKVIEMGHNKPSIPQEWANVIRGKKVVMYNISVAGILEYGIKAIAKMKYVFSCFRGRDDVVLLWRPHPLIEATLKSMRLELLQSYLELKEQFISKNWGIYDVTPDVTASVALSDAYVGEASSSVVHLFGAAGKPIFVSDMESWTEDDIVSLSFVDCCFEDDSAWFVANRYNALCKMDLKSGKTEIVAKISSEMAPWGQYGDVLKLNDKVFLMPMGASEICVYDLTEKTFKRTMISNSTPPNFDRMVNYNNSLFMKPICYPAILQYDIETGVCKNHDRWLKDFRNEDNSAMFRWGVSVHEQSLLMASSVKNEILEFNMETGRSKVHIVGSQGMNYFGMAYDGDEYWLIPINGNKIVRWNYQSGKTTEYSDYPKGFEGKDRCFVGIICCGSFLLAFPWEANMIVRIDVATGEMSEYALNLPYREGESRLPESYPSKYYFVKRLDDKHIAALTAFDNSLLVINTETAEWSLKPCRLNMDDVEPYYYAGGDFKGIGDNLPYAGLESPFFKLDRFIDQYVKGQQEHDRILQKDAYSAVIDNIDGTCGAKVHRHVKEQLLQYEE